MREWGYPAARPEARGDGQPLVAPRYEQIETSVELTSTNVDVLLIQFSGRPDAVDLMARTNAVMFTLQDEMGVELGELLVPAGVSYAPQVSANRVLIRSATTDVHGLAQAVGKWTAHRVERPAMAAGKAAVGP
jgi:hypothetical protein